MLVQELYNKALYFEQKIVLQNNPKNTSFILYNEFKNQSGKQLFQNTNSFVLDFY